jgi:hypothetical protein
MAPLEDAMTEPARLIPQDYDSHTVVGATDEALARVRRRPRIGSIAARVRSITAAACAPGLEARRRHQTASTRSPPMPMISTQAFHLLAIALDQLGHLREAFVTYERAFALDRTIPTCCSISD